MIAVIADMVESRRQSDRAALQQRLRRTLAAVNAEQAGKSDLPAGMLAEAPARYMSRQQPLASPYTITLGDEFQALYGRAQGLWRGFWQILAALHPVGVRFAIGVGTVATEINHEAALGMDGPAWHAAREAIQQAKSSGRRFVIAGATPRLGLLNSALALLSHEVDGWQANRLRVLTALMAGLPVKDIAADLDISEVAVYKNIHAGALEDVMRLTGQIEAAIEEAEHC